MEHSFDRDIKQKLQDITPEEAGYRPDRDKLWQSIEAKKAPKRKALPFWLGHAAAVAAGLLLGFFFFYPGKNIQQEHTVVGTHVAPIIKTIRDTVYMQQPATSVPVPAPSMAAHSSGHPGTPAAAKAGGPVPVQLPAEEQLPVRDPAPQEPLLAVNKPAPIKVLHLSDIDNENAHSKPEKQKVYALFNIIRIPTTSEDPTGTLTMSIGEQISQSIKN